MVKLLAGLRKPRWCYRGDALDTMDFPSRADTPSSHSKTLLWMLYTLVAQNISSCGMNPA